MKHGKRSIPTGWYWPSVQLRTSNLKISNVELEMNLRDGLRLSTTNEEDVSWTSKNWMRQTIHPSLTPSKCCRDFSGWRLRGRTVVQFFRGSHSASNSVLNPEFYCTAGDSILWPWPSGVYVTIWQGANLANGGPLLAVLIFSSRSSSASLYFSLCASSLTFSWISRGAMNCWNPWKYLSICS